jgi:K+-sensing histidine kinase KdpD
MDFKLVSKNNMGVVMTLILVILLSQARFFDFLIDTALGRMVLLVFIIFIAYTNKILGLVAVLFIIIAFNNNHMNMVYSYNYYEGFDVSGNSVDASGNALKGTIQNAVQTKLQSAQQDMSGNMMNSSTTATTTSSSVSGTESFKGREGFCMTDRESNMLRGKQSNTVPVFNNLREQSDDVSPSDKSVFTNEYASF